jgi:hypothetical protein
VRPHFSFDDEPLVPTQSDSHNTGEIDFRYFRQTEQADALRTKEGNTLTLLDEGTEGSLAACRAQTRFADRIALDLVGEGSQLCVRTAEGHVALVTVAALPSGSGPSDYITVDASVWRDAL